MYDYEALGRHIGAMVTAKQEAYGDSFGRAGPIMRILYPDGISSDRMDDALVVVRILDKLSRIATRRDAFGEDPFRDIAGYGILATARNEMKIKENEVMRSKKSGWLTYEDKDDESNKY